ncbi:hypothetical protein INR49_022485 [Caranx melampygus]|nr:hypothetical protein INR49_022485 [Caranx melampygus]
MARECVSSTQSLFVQLTPALAPINMWRRTSSVSQQFESLHVRALQPVCSAIRARR